MTHKLTQSFCSTLENYLHNIKMRFDLFRIAIFK